MAKDKVNGGPTQKHLHSRVSYLYQAAAYLVENTIRQQSSDANYLQNIESNNREKRDPSSTSPPPDSALEGNASISDSRKDEQMKTASQRILSGSSAAPSQRLLAHVRTILRKSQIRLAPHVKHSICKRCDALLISGSTSTTHVENKSKNGNKPWADVLKVVCDACGTAKRYPIGAKRQLKRQERLKTLKSTQGIPGSKASRAPRKTNPVSDGAHAPVSSGQPEPS